MWLVARCLKGIDPPPALTPEMIPPSFRSTKPAEGVVVSILKIKREKKIYWKIF